MLKNPWSSVQLKLDVNGCSEGLSLSLRAKHRVCERCLTNTAHRASLPLARSGCRIWCSRAC